MKRATGFTLMTAAVLGVGLLAPPPLSAQQQPDAADQAQPADRAADQEKTSKHKGEFFAAGDGEFSMTINGKNKHSHKLLEATKVTINGKPAKLTDLKKGDKIEVETTKNNEAVSISATRKKQQETAAADPQSPETQPSAAQRSATQPRELQAPSSTAEQTPMLGIRIAPSRTTGVRITDVRPGGAADQAGLQAGDYILSFNDKKLASPDDFDQAMSTAGAGEEADLQVWRDGRTMSMQIAFAQAGSETSRLGYRPDGQRRQSARRGADEGSAWLGVLLSEGEENQEGVLIERIYPSGPAARSGLRSGDVLIEVDGTELNSPDQAADVISSAEPNESIEMTVVRDGEEVTLTAVLADRNAFLPRDMQRSREGEGRSGFRPQIGQHAMMLEQHRRFAEQHERLENLMHEVLNEVKELRQEVRQLNGEGSAPPR